MKIFLLISILLLINEKMLAQIQINTNIYQQKLNDSILHNPIRMQIGACVIIDNTTTKEPILYVINNNLVLSDSIINNFKKCCLGDIKKLKIVKKEKMLEKYGINFTTVFISTRKNKLRDIIK